MGSSPPMKPTEWLLTLSRAKTRDRSWPFEPRFKITTTKQLGPKYSRVKPDHASSHQVSSFMCSAVSITRMYTWPVINLLTRIARSSGRKQKDCQPEKLLPTKSKRPTSQHKAQPFGEVPRCRAGLSCAVALAMSIVSLLVGGLRRLCLTFEPRLTHVGGKHSCRKMVAELASAVSFRSKPKSNKCSWTCTRGKPTEARALY